MRFSKWIAFPVMLMAATACGEGPDVSPFFSTGRTDQANRGPGGQLPTRPLTWLATLGERELARLFAAGTASEIPVGSNDGLPLLPGGTEILPILSKIYAGNVWEHSIEADGSARVRVRDRFLRTAEGHLVTLFEATASVGAARDVTFGQGISGPEGTRPPHLLSPAREPIVIDDRQSLWVSYREDAAPIVNRILDEIRAVDAERCPGLYLGRAHYRTWVGEWVYLYWFAMDFGRNEGQSCELAR